MKVKKGDKVRFLNDVGGGEVVRQIDGQTVLVLNQDGFEIPVLISELLLDVSLQEEFMGTRSAARVTGVEGTTRGQTPARQAPPQPRGAEPSASYPAPPDRTKLHFPLRAPQVTPAAGLYVGFHAVDEEDVQKGPYEMYVINESNEQAYVCVSRFMGEDIVKVSAQKVNACSARLATTIDAGELFKFSLLRVQAIYFSDKPHAPKDPLNINLELKVNRFVRPGAFQDNRFLDRTLLLFAARDAQQEALLRSIEQVDIEQIVKEKEAKPEPPKSVKHPEEFVIDLHMEALMPQHSPMSPKEALDYQLKAFEEAMEAALENQQLKRLVAIHGVGNGRLRAEVITTLRRRWPECVFQDASFKEYGYGATMVMLKRKPA